MTATPPEDWNSRTRLLLGPEAVERLAGSHVLVAGVGGVGGYVVEMLARSGVGAITAVDSDSVAPSNINRQIIADCASVGRLKVELWADRVRAINPQCRFAALAQYIDVASVGSLLQLKPDYVADCIDTVAPKVELLAQCLENGLRVVSSMGAGGRIDPSKIRLGRLADTRDDGLARAVRQGLKKRGSGEEGRQLRVVWSCEPPHRCSLLKLQQANKRSSYGTLASIPAIFGLFMANEIVLSLAGINCKSQ